MGNVMTSALVQTSQRSRTRIGVTAENPDVMSPNFRRLIGEKGWNELSAQIRSRFASSLGRGQSKHYAGTIDVQRSTAGFLWGLAAKVFGSPLISRAGNDIPIDVCVFHDPQRGGETWDRRYSFPQGTPITVRSTKKWDPGNGLLECVEGGVGMELRVFEESGTLNFQSERYFFELGPWKVPIPHFFTPGTLLVTHKDEGENLFRFTLQIRHRIWGNTFFQTGVFRQKEVL